MSSIALSHVMYSHCLHCNAKLGTNDVLEAFPVGRRVAFDSLKGRLWVVCAKCERWNLAPFESRYEAIEQAERAYRSTSVRMSTDNIGLARWGDGTTLVRVGRPLRPEFAAWRYGDQFGRRRRRVIIGGSLLAAGGAAIVGGAVVSGAGLVALLPIAHSFNLIMLTKNQRATLTPLAHPDGKWFLPFGNPRIVAGTRGPNDWAIEVGWMRRLDQPRVTLRSWFGNGQNFEQGRVTLSDDLARDALAKLLPRVNGGGAPGSRVRQAVSLIEDAGGSEGVMSWAARQRRAWGAQQNVGDTGDIAFIPKPARLAIEMAVHEERERLALLGELVELERAWQTAEEVAAIADQLLTPESVNMRLDKLRVDSDRSAQ